jgi:hypothetical protein
LPLGKYNKLKIKKTFFTECNEDEIDRLFGGVNGLFFPFDKLGKNQHGIVGNEDNIHNSITQLMGCPLNVNHYQKDNIGFINGVIYDTMSNSIKGSVVLWKKVLNSYGVSKDKVRGFSIEAEANYSDITVQINEIKIPFDECDPKIKLAIISGEDRYNGNPIYLWIEKGTFTGLALVLSPYSPAMDDALVDEIKMATKESEENMLDNTIVNKIMNSGKPVSINYDGMVSGAKENKEVEDLGLNNNSEDVLEENKTEKENKTEEENKEDETKREEVEEKSKETTESEESEYVENRESKTMDSYNEIINLIKSTKESINEAKSVFLSSFNELVKTAVMEAILEIKNKEEKKEEKLVEKKEERSLKIDNISKEQKNINFI